MLWTRFPVTMGDGAVRRTVKAGMVVELLSVMRGTGARPSSEQHLLAQPINIHMGSRSTSPGQNPGTAECGRLNMRNMI